jgi:peptidyl-prolyl cis-trans isomerase D
MLQDIRQHTQGAAAKIIIGLIVISFAFFGIQSILVSGGDNEIADVNGELIYPQQLQQALDAQKRRLISMMGDQFDPAMLDDERLAPQALESLITRALLMQAALALKLVISENDIGATVAGMEQFQIDGQFSAAVYKSVLSSAGYTPSYFKQTLSEDMLLSQLRSGIAGSEFVTSSELALNSEFMMEQRDLRFFTIPLERFTSISPPTDAEVDSYYADHQEEFRTQESVDIDYLELTMDDYRQSVSESEILEAYEQAKEQLQYQSQSRVSHILFETDGDTEIQERVSVAQEKLAAGVNFSDVASELSDDIGSVDKGGDLGYTSGDAFPEEMEVVIAQLEPGVVSAPLETSAGTHLILVTEREQAAAPSLEDMRASLENSIQEGDAREMLLLTVESLRDASFNAENLRSPAADLDLVVKQADAVTRSEAEGLFSNPSLVAAAFSEDVLLAGNNSDVIELAGNSFVVLNVRQHNESEIKTLPLVRQQVVAALLEEKAQAAVLSEATSALQALRNGLAAEQFADANDYDFEVELGVERRNTMLPPAVLGRTFQLPVPTEGAVSTDFISMPNGDAVVIELLGVSAGVFKSLSTQEQAQFQQLLATEAGRLIDSEYQRGLRERAKISIL